MTFEFSSELAELAKHKATISGFTDVQQYLEHLIHQDQPAAESEDICSDRYYEHAVSEGLSSGASTPLRQEDWDELHRVVAKSRFSEGDDADRP